MESGRSFIQLPGVGDAGDRAGRGLDRNRTQLRRRATLPARRGGCDRGLDVGRSDGDAPFPDSICRPCASNGPRTSHQSWRRNETRLVWALERTRLLWIGALNPLSYILVLTALTLAPPHIVPPMREIRIVLGAILGAKFLGQRQPKRRLIGAAIMVLGVLCLTGCATERPLYPRAPDRLADLRVAFAPSPPELRTDDTPDEAEIQFRAAFLFYRRGQWNYAVPAFAEAVDYDDARDDARFYWAASLVMAERNEEALPVLEELLETPFEMRARGLLARVLFRQGKHSEAREAAAAATEDHDAAGWIARYDLLSK